MIQSIGVSNYGIAHLKVCLRMPVFLLRTLTTSSQEIIDNPEFKYRPSVNQIDLHPFMQRREIAAFCQKEGIRLEVAPVLC
jgi:diketogulonate reductase-like aldo/keto reductase